MKYFTLIVLCMLCSTSVLGDELRWGEFGFLSNWHRYPYKTKNDYEYMGRLPDLKEFPKLLELADAPETNRFERDVLVDQLRTLSRCDFEGYGYEDPDGEAGEQAAIKRWESWWKNYGKKLAKELPVKGRRYEKAWKIVAPTPYLECPKYPILIPENWTATVTFRSGDYGGVTEEIIDFQVSKDICKLSRKYQTGWNGDENWTHEVWKDFSREEADQFFAALTYAIDNPWFFGDDELHETVNNKSMGHVRGRPKAWSTYYDSVRWTGIKGKDGKVIINHDPWHWHSLDPKRLAYNGGANYRSTSLDYPTGVVFRVVRDLFPDPSWIPSRSRWKKVASLPLKTEAKLQTTPESNYYYQLPDFTKPIPNFP